MSLHGTDNVFDERGNLVRAAPLTRAAIADARRRTHLHVSSFRNSTKFTNCCGLAVHDEKVCPGCKAPIFR